MLRNVLLLDDDAYFHRAIAPALRAEDVCLLHAYSLADADAILADRRVDAMVVDSHLPDGEGEAWIQGRRNRGDRTPVIFLSPSERVLDVLRQHESSLQPIVLVTKGALRETLRAITSERLPEVAGPASNTANIGTRVLVLDEDPEFRAAAAEAGKRQLIEIVGAPSVLAAEARVREGVFDGVVIGAHTGDMTPFAFARELRSMPGYTSLPLAFVSSDASIRTRIEAVHAGATLYLKKPLDVDALAAALRDLVGETHSVRPRALIVDQDPQFGASVVELLRGSGIDARSLTDARAALSAVEYYRPDVLLLAVSMQGVSGLDLCRILRTSPTSRTLPILLVSRTEDVQDRIAAFEAGADDLIGKPLVAQELLARVRGRLDRQRLLRDQAERDSLTGLLLRGPVVDALHAKLADAQRKGTPVSVAIIDLDGFKDINDTYGHLAGDRVLVTVGRLLATRFRGEDVRGRWGGEEFIIGFPGEASEVAEGLVFRVLRELREMRFEGDRGEPFQITFSAGVAAFPEAGITVEAILKTADRRLYRAKRLGKNRVIRTEGTIPPPPISRV